MTQGDASISSTEEYYNCLQQAAEVVKSRLGAADIAIVLGSGLSAFDEILENKKSINYSEVPFMPLPSVAGHSGRLSLGNLGSNRVLCFAGRVHAYENYHGFQLSFQTRLAALVGCKILFVTNAAGGFIPGLIPGDAMIISDHVNFHFSCPIIDTAGDARFGSARSVESDNLYSSRIATLAKSVASEIGMRLHSGIYTWEPGPSYETKSEVEALLEWGVHAFGMSTIPEVIAARAMGLEVFALSVITNLAAGKGGELLHDEVQEVANKSSAMLRALLVGVLSKVEPLPLTLPSLPSPLLAPLPLKPPPVDLSSADVEACYHVADKVVKGSGSTIDTVLVYGSEVWKLTDLDKVFSVENCVELPPAFVFGSASRRSRLCHVKSGASHLLLLDIASDEGVKDELLVAIVLALAKAGVTKMINLIDAHNRRSGDLPVGPAVVADGISHMCRIPRSKPLSSPSLAAAVSSLVKHAPVSVMEFPGPVLPTPAESMIAHNAAKVDAICVTTLSSSHAANVLGISPLTLALPPPSAADVLPGIIDAVVGVSLPPLSSDSIPAFSIFDERGRIPPPPTRHSLSAHPHDNGPVSYVECVSATDEVKDKLGSDAIVALWIDSRLPLSKDIFVEDKHVNLSSIVPSLSEEVRVKISAGKWRQTAALVFRNVPAALDGLVRPRSERYVAACVRIARLYGVKAFIVVAPFSGVDSPPAGSVSVAVDHQNLTGVSPLGGVNIEQFGTRFPDMSRPYSAALNEAAAAAVTVTPSCVLNMGNFASTEAELRFTKNFAGKTIGDFGTSAATTAAHAKMPAALVGPIYGENFDESHMADTIKAVDAMVASLAQ